MTDNNHVGNESHDSDRPPEDEGGLRPPPGLSFWKKLWWWFHFLILVKIARLRFIGILLAIGWVIVEWDTIIAYYESWTRPSSQAQKASSDTEYYCPMHPTVIRDNPKDKCPICFMPLSKRKKGDNKEEALPPGIVNRVQLSPYRVVLAGVQTWKVTHVPLTKEINTVGYVEFNEREMKHVAARVKGRIDALFVSETGQMVHAGDELASLYSPDMVVTVQNLLDAHKNGNANLQDIAINRLQLWGISKDQIDEILKTGQANTHLKIRSPINGHVLKKYVKEGQYVDEGSPLYDVVDLSTVWIQAQVYEEDMVFLPIQQHALKKKESAKADLHVEATSRSFPGHTFRGKRTFVFPHVDQDTRTVTVRIELDNLDYKLRPGTTAMVTLKVPPTQIELFSKMWADDWLIETVADVSSRSLFAPLGLREVAGIAPLLRAAARYVILQQGLILAVPDTAVIDTGSLRLVYREIAPGAFEGVKVELGPRMVGPNDTTFYPVLRGIGVGDMVVTAGSFLIDAETRLNPAAGSIYFGGSGGSKSSTSTVRPSTPEDEEAKAKALLAALPAGDRLLAEAQQFCPALKDSRLGSMGVPVKMMIQDQPVFLCCKSCAKGALANPKDTLAKVEKLKKAKRDSLPR